MKVLLVSCEGLGNGGVQAVIMTLCRNMPEIQFDIILFTSERRYYDDEFEMLGGKIYRIPNYEGSSKYRRKLDYYIRFFRIFLRAYAILKSCKYDVIHCHNSLESGICNLAAYFAGVKVRISHTHTANNQYSKKNIIAYLYKKFLQILVNCCSNVKISCTTESFISIFGNKYLKKTSSLIIPNAIDLSKFRRTQFNVKLLTTRINIVHIGRYCENKNQMFLIEFLPHILKEFPNTMLQLIGFGIEYKEQLQKRANLLCIESKVKFLSSDSNKKEILEKADLFIFPSLTEGFGIALLEAQAMEVPCLVSDSVPKEVDCGLCKFLPLSENHELWATEAVNIIKNNSPLKLDEEKLISFDVKKYAKKIKAIYEGMVI